MMTIASLSSLEMLGYHSLHPTVIPARYNRLGETLPTVLAFSIRAQHVESVGEKDEE